MTTATIKKTAILSDCRRYRYTLTREWDETRPRVCWVMLNPSTADADVDDPTIRKCMKFSQRLGYGGLIVVNLYAFRATDPDDLHDADEPVGKDNVEYIERALAQTCGAIAAWGEGIPKIRGGMKLCIDRLFEWGYTRWSCFGVNKSGMPKHPLYIRDDAPLIEWRGYVGQRFRGTQVPRKDAE